MKERKHALLTNGSATYRTHRTPESWNILYFAICKNFTSAPCGKFRWCTTFWRRKYSVILINFFSYYFLNWQIWLFLNYIDWQVTTLEPPSLPLVIWEEKPRILFVLNRNDDLSILMDKKKYHLRCKHFHANLLFSLLSITKIDRKRQYFSSLVGLKQLLFPYPFQWWFWEGT